MARKKILVVGDIILDRYTFVDSERMSAEAPIPVWDELRFENRLGGASNVANNLMKLVDDQEADVHIAGVVGKNYFFMLQDVGLKTDLCRVDKTIIKHRYVDDRKQEYVMRVDNMKRINDGSSTLFESTFLSLFDKDVYDGIVISDYNIGTVTEEIARTICENSKSRVFVDSKRTDLSRFRGAYLLKLNEAEYGRQVSSKLYTNVESLVENVVVTKGSKGSELRICEKSDSHGYVVHAEEFPTMSVKSVDVTGCGDTFVAGLVYFMTMKQDDLRKAIKFASVCAAQVVQKFGTSVVTG